MYVCKEKQKKIRKQTNCGTNMQCPFEQNSIENIKSFNTYIIKWQRIVWWHTASFRKNKTQQNRPDIFSI